MSEMKNIKVGLTKEAVVKLRNREKVEIVAGNSRIELSIAELEMESERKKAIKILDLFEDLLEKHGLTVPSEERESDDDEASKEKESDIDEARLYGTKYYDLEEQIVNVLKESD